VIRAANLFDDMVANEQATLSLARQFPGILKGRAVAPPSVLKRYQNLLLQQGANGAALRFALARAGVHFCT